MRMVCLAPYLPYEGVDHAGGEYLLRYLEVAHGLGHAVTLIVPDTKSLATTFGRQPSWLRVLVGPADRAGNAVRAWRLIRHGSSSLPSRAFFARLSTEAQDTLREADVVDLQWMGSVQHATTFRERHPAAALIATPHDVYSDSVRGALRSTSPFRRAVARLALHSVLRTERKQLSACDQVFVFKEADIFTLSRLGIEAQVRTTPPVVELPTHAIDPVESGLLVFTAAFWREENDEAARWFLDEVLPIVHRTHPGVRVRFAGSRPSPWLMSQSGSHVDVTGYLPHLIDAYRGAQVAIAPLRRGAGLKFKVAQAMALGFPVVATTTGAEGIDDLVGARVTDPTDDPESFATRVCSTIDRWSSSRDEASQVAAKLRARLDFPRQVGDQIAGYRPDIA